jgi:hypothetical protein
MAAAWAAFSFGASTTPMCRARCRKSVTRHERSFAAVGRFEGLVGGMPWNIIPHSLESNQTSRPKGVADESQLA